MSKATAVKCFCGWRGKRVKGECTCYDEYAMYCACAWGYCPKCGGRVCPIEYFRDYGKQGESQGEAKA